MDQHNVLATPRQLTEGYVSQGQPVTPYMPGSYERTPASGKYNTGHFDDLPPSLAAGSSSPFFESPRTVRNHNRILKPHQIGGYNFSPSPLHGNDSSQKLAHLSSSPPEQFLQTYNTNRPSKVPNAHLVWDPTLPANPTEALAAGYTSSNEVVKITPKRLSRTASVGSAQSVPYSSSPANAAAGPLVGLSAFLSPRPSSTPVTPSKKRKRVENSKEYWIMGSNFGFAINDATGRAEFTSLKNKHTKISNQGLEQLLGSDSDSDSDSETEWDDSRTGSGNAMEEFAKIVARSRVDSHRESRKGRRTIGVQETPRLRQSDLTFFAPISRHSDPYQLNPTTPKSVGRFHNSMGVGSSFNPNMVTPPGAVFTVDNAQHAFSTGMTPYLPRN